MDISSLKGIGPKTEKILKNNGIMTTNDLISYYPFRYDVIKRSNINELIQDDKIIIDGMVESKPSLFFFNKKMNKMSFKINIGTHLLNAVIFNRGFLKNKIEVGKIITLIGKYDKLHNTIVASDIRFSELPSVPVIEPIYHQIGGLTSNQIRGYINSINEYDIVEYIPEYLKEKYKLIEKIDAVKNIHNPKEELNLRKAQAYLKYEELFLFMLKMNSLKMNKKNKLGLERNVDKKLVEEFISNLPFELTIDQRTCIDKIYDDLVSKNRMNRLVQGDVGSGKTIVAIIALYINYLSGYQSAMMAPTEILATQHYEDVCEFVRKYQIGFRPVLLVGSMTAKEKKQAYEKLASGEANLVIGTHAVIQEKVVFKNLALVVTDEQHRFGVRQREKLAEKGKEPHVLVMSATPIPRTLNMALSGIRDMSTLEEPPADRYPVQTFVMEHNNAIVDDAIRREVERGGQVYYLHNRVETIDQCAGAIPRISKTNTQHDITIGIIYFRFWVRLHFPLTFLSRLVNDGFFRFLGCIVCFSCLFRFFQIRNNCFCSRLLNHSIFCNINRNIHVGNNRHLGCACGTKTYGASQKQRYNLS